MMKPTRIAALWLAMVFLAGALFGFVAHSFYADRTTLADRAARPSNPKDFRERYLAKLKNELSLSPEQLDQVRAILDQTGQRFHELREQFHDKLEPEFETVRQMQRQRIMAVLTPEQQPKYQKIIEEQRRRHEKDKEKGSRR